MQQQRRRNSMILGLLSLSMLAVVASPAQAVDAIGLYYATPAWDQKLAPVARFVVLTDWNNEAVLDKETGLIWERSPVKINSFLWRDALISCMNRATGARKGWRLPLVHELATLIDPSHGNPALPPGHPFLITLPIVNVHWSATTNADNATQAWYVNFENSFVGDLGPKAGGQANAWCVRGGMNAAAY